MLLIIYLILCLVMSLYTIIIYKIDKVNAIEDRRRISEKHLLLVSLLFGGFGSLIGMYTFRHKTKHINFIILNWLFTICQFALAIFISINL